MNQALFSKGNDGSRDGPVFASLFVIALAVLFGGQGNGSAVREMIVQLAAIALLVATFKARKPPSNQLIRASYWLIISIFGLIILHLLPLPFVLWEFLHPVPVAQQVLSELGLGYGWRPFTLVPNEAFDNLLLMIPPVAIFAAVVRMDGTQRAKIALGISAVALLSAVLGLLQYAGGTTTLHMYTATNRGFGVGFFSNRNHQADLMIVGWLTTAAVLGSPHLRMGSMGRGMRLGILAALSGVFVLAVLATGSRGGLALALVAWLAIVTSQVGDFGKRGLAIIAGFVAFLFAAGSGALLSGNRIFAATLSRFGGDDEMRFLIWPRTIDFIGETLPFGIGIGSFVDYYKAKQPLAEVGPKFINSAHNEYLEIALEAGLPGIILMLAGLGILAWAAVKVLRQGIGRDGTSQRIAVLAVFAILVLLIHSSFDYPLRTTTLVVIFAALCGLIMPKPHDSGDRLKRPPY